MKSKEKKTNLQELLEISSLIVALAAVIILVFYLFFAFEKCIIFTEPAFSIRASEVFLGLVSIPVIINLIRKKLIKIYFEKE